MVESVEGRWLIAAVLETVERAQEKEAESIGRGKKEEGVGSGAAAQPTLVAPPPLEWHNYFLESIFENDCFPTLYEGG